MQTEQLQQSQISFVLHENVLDLIDKLKRYCSYQKWAQITLYQKRIALKRNDLFNQ